MTDPTPNRLDIAHWKALPHIQGRLATQDDVRAGLAVFYIADGRDAAEPATLNLPVCGMQRQEEGTTLPVVVVQAERFKGDTILGVLYLNGGKGMCTLEEMELLEAPDERFATNDEHQR